MCIHQNKWYEEDKVFCKSQNQDKEIEEHNRIKFWKEHPPPVVLKYGTFFFDFHVVNIYVSYHMVHIISTKQDLEDFSW